MVLRTKGNPHTIDTFKGVNDLVDQVDLIPELVRTSMGGIYTEESKFQRMNGKIMNSNSTYDGRVLDVHQLRFDDVDVVVFHSSNQVIYDNDMSMLVSSASVFSPLGPFV